jgi:hypothetical protein
VNNWIEVELNAVNLPDKRLNRRLKSIVTHLSKDPQKSIPNNCESWSETQAAYRFLNNPSVTGSEILKGHTRATLERIEKQKVVLIAQDATFINLATEDRKAEMGTLVCRNKNEYLLHPSVAFTPDRTNLGVVSYVLWKRPEINTTHKYHTPFKEKESYRWIASYKASCHLQKQFPETVIVNIADRESDIYELFTEFENTKTDEAAEYIIRAKCNRRLEEEDETIPHLWEKLHARKSQGVYQLKLQRTKYRQAREATIEVRYQAVTMARGRRKGGNLPAVTLYAVLAKEVNQPKDEKPIEWMLLTSLPIENLEQAQTVIGWYRCRWEIEIYFRALKSGCKVQELRLESDEGIEKALAIYMIIAWRLHNITMLAREEPDIPCNEVFDKKEWQLIYKLQKKTKPKDIPTIKEITRLLAMRGGFLGRKGDGVPGFETIWRGYVKILNYLEIESELHSLRLC